MSTNVKYVTKKYWKATLVNKYTNIYFIRESNPLKFVNYNQKIGMIKFFKLITLEYILIELLSLWTILP